MRRISLLIAVSLLLPVPAAAGWSTKEFTKDGIYGIPSCSGIYIIKRNGDPYYVGRSRRSIQERLQRHVTGSGSRKVAGLLGSSDRLTVEYECLSSVEQMEAQLIADLGTTRFGNLRRETDPADWDD